MADFRRVLTVLAVLAVMAGAASAQVGAAQVNGSANSALLCTATGAGIPELRPEGYTELAGDILITCTGGPNEAAGTQIQSTNITIFVQPSVPVTSRYMGRNTTGGQPTDALLIIDEPGSGIPTGAPAGWGTKAPQSLCTASAEQAVIPNTCTAYVGVVSGQDSAGNSVNYEVAMTAPSSGGAQSNVAAPNIYQGVVAPALGANLNTVTFYNVPVLPPSTTGVSRVYRITNVRLGLPVLSPQQSTPVIASISTSPSVVLPLTTASVTIATVGPSSTFAVKHGPTFQQCIPQTVQLAAQLIYTEGFATAFKTRVVPDGAKNITGGGGNNQWSAEDTNNGGGMYSFYQNIPGGAYGLFAQNSESGFIFPGLSTTSGSGTNAVTSTAGLADYGTRLKAVFYNIPAGLTLYVSTTSGTVNATANPNFLAGGTATNSYAVLVAAGSGEATPDASPFAPITSTIPGNLPPPALPGTPDGLTAIALTPNSTTGAATAVWEVTNSNPSGIDTLTFNVYISYAPTAPTTANPYGTPVTGAPPGAPFQPNPNDVQLSFAPEPSQGVFGTANASAGNLPIPRFQVVKTQEGYYVSIVLCQTTLLYPFVTGVSGFDTGLAVANTSMDPFSTPTQQGSCTLYFYGVTVAAAGNTPFAQPLKGCDLIPASQATPGTNCFPVVPAGQVMNVQAATVFPGFEGYVIAICNFQYAHGYAAVTDLGLRNLWSSYLALELAPPQVIVCSGGVCVSAGGVGSPRNGIQSIEELVH